MAAKPVTLKLQSRGKPIPRLPKETSIYIQGSTSDLYHRIAAEAKFSVHRLRLTKEDGTAIPNEKSVTVDSLGLAAGGVVQAKDLGPQIAWRTVFIIEYAGPLLIHPIVYFLRPFLYGRAAAGPPSTLQTLTMAMIVLHFLKRELETIFVHRFSLATMPFRNVFKNSAHYWLFGGALIALTVYRPAAAAAADSIPALTYTALALFVIGELGNLNAHLVLRGLRSPGGTERGVPKGLGFDLVTCPNYLFETMAWLGILLVSRSWATGIFVAIAVGQMAVWAQKKERRYRKELGGKYQKKRFAMLPGIV